MSERDPRHTPHMDDPNAAFVRRGQPAPEALKAERGAAPTSEAEIVLGLLRRLLDESYWDTSTSTGGRCLLIDGSILDPTEDELAAFFRWLGPDPELS